MGLFQINNLVAIAVAALAVFGWVVFVTEEWVRDAAHAYARALLATCDA